ncbi:hypothetical protein [Chryseobacterium sp. PMSZPI]|uniref:hypothetical protein n=1 Tax=Chryseobacterium sp. PMSZPI TaxID=1033900 RepID=UPI000C3486C8|nr:hypothetical protein [Chryseobacterium sp. PMSZPI]PKF72900.1 hypothetical protein CW752_15035 [Chryseobacterium sp. PMSZPI]
MNPRVLELLKNPKNILSEDLNLLKEEIHAFPYIQNIRALHLYGVHLYDKENYQKELSTTAAYTTDKKILYQLINGVIKRQPEPEIGGEKQSSKQSDKPRYAYKGFPIKREAAPEKEIEKAEACILPTSLETKPVFVNGERNRILFEGEENFLDEVNPEKIDIESTLESGTLVIQKQETLISEPVKEEEETEQVEIEERTGESFSPETIINEDEITSEAVEEKVDKAENISFHETEALLPEINVEEEVNKVSEEIESVDGNNEISNPEETPVEPDAELSFHGSEAFLPDVKIQPNNEEVIDVTESSQPNVNKHEEEMRRLIQEVEKKMKETKPDVDESKEEPEVPSDHEISFAETQSFHFWSTEKEETPKVEDIKAEPSETVATEVQEPIVETMVEITAAQEEAPVEESAWKPMSFESNMPDSLISKPEKLAEPKVVVPIQEETTIAETEDKNTETAIEEVEHHIEDSSEEFLPIKEDVTPEETKESSESIENKPDVAIPNEEEARVMNVSFFGTDISSLKVEKEKEENKEVPQKEETMQRAVVNTTTQSSTDSNVPGFINTWQSWLKIDRTEETEKEKSEIKEKAIETFIENNPRISQLKEESTYVVKEKNDDISHLMTETLANLYFEQKLYTKAIKAYEILIRKSPEKKEHFEARIKEIKDFRSKN